MVAGYLVVAALAMGALAGIAPSRAEAAVMAPFSVVHEPSSLVQTVKYYGYRGYYGRPRFYGHRGFYGPGRGYYGYRRGFYRSPRYDHPPLRWTPRVSFYGSGGADDDQEDPTGVYGRVQA